MNEQGAIFRDAEADANKYAAHCLIAACSISILVWFLNFIGFFIVNDVIMNTSTPICVLVLLSPTVLLKYVHVHGPWVKYYISICFVVGIAILHTGMTYQVTLAWACPLLLSCHFYSQRVTTVTYLTSLAFLFFTIFAGAIYGTWDCNMMDSTRIDGGAQAHIDYLLTQHSQGQDTLINIIKLYFVSRALILTVVYVICTTLSKRTYQLLDMQQADLADKERIDAELSVASEIQNAMLPDTSGAFPLHTAFALCASMTPSKEVGGDFYDFFFVDDDHLALVMADVAGKGVPAAMFMMATKIMIKNLTTVDKTPGQVLTEVNAQLCETNHNHMFVTVWFGIYQLSTGTIIATNAGHEYPIIQKNTSSFEVLKDKHGFVLGGMDGIRYRNYELHLDKGDTLFLYTDGVVEANDAHQQLYGMDRLLAQLNRTPQTSLEDLLQGVKQDVDVFAKTMPQFDDITMMAIRRN